MKFNKVLNHFKVASFSFNRGPSENAKGSYFFLGFLLVPIHVCDLQSNWNGFLWRFEEHSCPINSNRNHMNSNRKPRNPNHICFYRIPIGSY